MSLGQILNKLTLEEIEELSKSLQNQHESFFGNKLKDSKNRALISKALGLKNWNTLVGMKKVESKDNCYLCPECGSKEFYCKIDAFDYHGLNSKGETTESKEVAHYDDFEYTCMDCNYTSEIIFLTYELILEGFKDDGTTDHLVVWVNVEDKYDYSFEEILKENKKIKEFSKINFVSKDEAGLDLQIQYYPTQDSIVKLNNIIDKKMGVN